MSADLRAPWDEPLAEQAPRRGLDAGALARRAAFLRANCHMCSATEAGPQQRFFSAGRLPWTDNDLVAVHDARHGRTGL